ncbi:flagellin, partial [Rhizobium ruizarguesonis]
NSGATSRNYYLLNANSTTPATCTEIAIGKNTTDAQLTYMLDVTDSLLSSLTTTAASIGGRKTRSDDQIDYTADLSDSID